MDQLAGPSSLSRKGQKRKIENKRTFQQIALDFIERIGNQGVCRIDVASRCSYTQATCDVGNFIRHFRTQHADAARKHGLAQDPNFVPKKARIIAKRLIAIDRRLLLEALTKLVCYHNLPLSCVEWEGLKLLIDPIAAAVNCTVNRLKNKAFLHAIANRVRGALADEMKNRLICLKVDSASRFNRHVLGINVQYVLDNDKIVIRTLGMVEILESQTAAFLKSKILDVLETYGVTVDQIFSVTVDNGANMVAAVKGLKQEFDMLASLQLLSDDDNDGDQLKITVSELESENELEAENCDDKSDELSDALSVEFQDQLNLVRCSVHTLQLAILDVIDKKDVSVKQITEIAKNCKKIKYKKYFSRHDASYPPVWSATRWGGIFKMFQEFRQQKDFFLQLGLQYPELELTPKHWEFIEHYVQAFEPCYITTKKLQEHHVSLNDFYISWLSTINEVRNMFSNPFAQPLVNALTERLTKLKMSQAFQMALYLDPRLNFLDSKMFADDENLHIQNCIKETWNRIRKLKPSPASEKAAENKTHNNSGLDDFLTEMFGGTLSNKDSSKVSSFAKQLKGLDADPRQNHVYDVFKHWLKRRETHPELFEVAMVVLATP